MNRLFGTLSKVAGDTGCWKAMVQFWVSLRDGGRVHVTWLAQSCYWCRVFFRPLYSDHTPLARWRQGQNITLSSPPYSICALRLQNVECQHFTYRIWWNGGTTPAMHPPFPQDHCFHGNGGCRWELTWCQPAHAFYPFFKVCVSIFLFVIC